MKNFLLSSVALAIVFSLSSVAIAQRFKSVNTDKVNSSSHFAGNADVKFGKIDAFSDGNGVLLKWETERELNNLGFNIYRNGGKDSIKVNKTLIPGSYLRTNFDSDRGDSYTFFDANGTINSVYRIESFDINQQKVNSNDLYTRYEANFKAVAGVTSQTWQKRVSSSNKFEVKSGPVLPGNLKAQVEARNSFTDLGTQQFVASQPGVKIGVKETGIYRVPKADLQSGGFDTSSSPTLWKLYLNGVEQAINVESNGDYIEFYGKGIDTLQSDVNQYFLIVGSTAGKRIGTTFRRRIGGSVVGKNFEFSLQRRERSLYVSSILNGEPENFYGAVISPTQVSVEFDLSGVDFSQGKSNLDLGFHGLTATEHSVEVTVNGKRVGTIGGTGRQAFSGAIGVPVPVWQNGVNTLELKSVGPGSDISLLEKFAVNFKRLYIADQDEISFYTRNLRVTTVSGFTSPDIRVFDTTYPDSPSLISNASVDSVDKFGSEFSVTLPAHRTRQMLALTDSQLKQPESITQNIPSTLSSTSNGADLIIVTNRLWLTEANAWAAYRQNQGVSVAVVDVEDAYDEFGFGINGSQAITDFLSFAKDNWQTSPGYVLLMGDSSYDPKNYTGDGFHNYLPIRMVDTVYEETGSDDALVDFDDNGSADLAVGRIPARVGQDITDALAKVTTFEQSVSTAPARGSLCASDVPQGYDFAGLCDRVHNELPASIPTSVVNRADADAKADLLSEMNSGKYVVNYSGHGSTGVWAASSFFGNGDVPSLVNQTDLSIYTMLTCLNGYFLRPVDDSLSERLLKSNDGGAVSVWSSSGSTTPDVQEVMARRFFNQLGNNPDMDRLGDLIVDAKSVLIGGRDVKRSWVLLGDPMLKVK